MDMLRALQSCIRDRAGAAPCATLEMAREHVVALNVASESFAITDVPREHIDTLPGRTTPRSRLRNIVPALQACIANKCMLFETASPPGPSR